MTDRDGNHDGKTEADPGGPKDTVTCQEMAESRWGNVFYPTLRGLALRLLFTRKQIKDPFRSEWKTILQDAHCIVHH